MAEYSAILLSLGLILPYNQCNIIGLWCQKYSIVNQTKLMKFSRQLFRKRFPKWNPDKKNEIGNFKINENWQPKKKKKFVPVSFIKEQFGQWLKIKNSWNNSEIFTKVIKNISIKFFGEQLGYRQFISGHILYFFSYFVTNQNKYRKKLSIKYRKDSIHHCFAFLGWVDGCGCGCLVPWRECHR